MRAHSCRQRSSRRTQRGAGLVEYIVVTLLVVLVLVADQNVITLLASDLRKVYAALVYTISVCWT